LINTCRAKYADGPTPCGASTVNGRSDQTARSWWRLGRSATLALVIGLMVTAALRRRPELVYTNDHSEPECECRDCSATWSAVAFGITVNPGQPLTPMGAPAVASLRQQPAPPAT